MAQDNPSPEELERRRRWFEHYIHDLDNNSVVRGPMEGESYPCPCCGCLTLTERGGFEICAVCFWEDDGQDDHDADVIRGGPNGVLSLSQARSNFKEFGASDRKYLASVRPPLPEEKPNQNDQI